MLVSDNFMAAYSVIEAALDVANVVVVAERKDGGDTVDCTQITWRSVPTSSRSAPSCVRRMAFSCSRTAARNAICWWW